MAPLGYLAFAAGACVLVVCVLRLFFPSVSGATCWYVVGAVWTVVAAVLVVVVHEECDGCTGTLAPLANAARRLEAATDALAHEPQALADDARRSTWRAELDARCEVQRQVEVKIRLAEASSRYVHLAGVVVWTVSLGTWLDVLDLRNWKLDLRNGAWVALVVGVAVAVLFRCLVRRAGESCRRRINDDITAAELFWREKDERGLPSGGSAPPVAPIDP